MLIDPKSLNEWQRGWRVVVGAMICSGLGMPLFYYVFSLFTLPLTKEFGVTRGEMSNVQALLVVGALVAPVIGRAFDRRGFAVVFTLCALAVIAAHVAMASVVTTFLQFAVLAFVYGVAGVGCGPLAYTRPINAWFWHSRGLALGLAAIGVAVSTVVISPWLASIIETNGWRSGFAAIAAISGLIGLPLTVYLMQDAPPEGPAGPVAPVSIVPQDRSFFRERDFILLVLGMICVAIPGAGLVSQISPLMQEEGISSQAAAYGISAYAIGQVAGRIITGWFLDRANPRLVALIFTLVPALGFIILSTMSPPLWLIVLSVGLIGIQQGAEIDLFAFFTSRRFGIERYGTIYGWIIAASWFGNAAGIVTFGQLHDAYDGYTEAEVIAAILMAAGAVLIAMVRIAPTAEALAPEGRVEPDAARPAG
jgi:MFS family permease